MVDSRDRGSQRSLAWQAMPSSLLERSGAERSRVAGLQLAGEQVAAGAAGYIAITDEFISYGYIAMVIITSG